MAVESPPTSSAPLGLRLKVPPIFPSTSSCGGHPPNETHVARVIPLVVNLDNVPIPRRAKRRRELPIRLARPDLQRPPRGGQLTSGQSNTHHDKNPISHPVPFQWQGHVATSRQHTDYRGERTTRSRRQPWDLQLVCRQKEYATLSGSNDHWVPWAVSPLGATQPRRIETNVMRIGSGVVASPFWATQPTAPTNRNNCRTPSGEFLALQLRFTLTHSS